MQSGLRILFGRVKIGASGICSRPFGVAGLRRFDCLLFVVVVVAPIDPVYNESARHHHLHAQKRREEK